MRNYVSVNAKYYKMSEIDRISRHNFRLDNPSYQLEQKYIKYANKDIIYNKDLDRTIDNLTKEQRDIILRSQFFELRNMKSEILKKSSGKHRSNENELVEMVVSLSQEQALIYLKSGQNLMHGFDKFAKDMKQKYGFTPLQISLHCDEGHVENEVVKLNVHAHVTFFNYDFEKERSVLRNLHKQDFRDIQDLAQKSFQSVNLDFKRGVGKEITGKKHLETNDFVLQKQTKLLRENELKLGDLIKSTSIEIKALNTLKNEHKALLSTLSKDSVEHKELYKKIGVLQVEEKELRATLRDVKQQKQDLVVQDSNEAKKHVSDLTHTIINKRLEKPLALLGKEVIVDIKSLKQDVCREINKALDTNLKFKDLEQKDNKIKDLEQELKQSKNLNKDLITERNEANQKNNLLESDNIVLKQQSTKLVETLEKQQKAHKTQLNTSNQKVKRFKDRLSALSKFLKDNNIKIMSLKAYLKNSRNISKKQKDENTFSR